MLAEKLPSKLKALCLNQIEHALFSLSFSNKVTLALSKYIDRNHISVSTLCEKLSTIDNLEYFWLPNKDLSESNSKTQVWIFISRDGDSFIGEKGKNEKYVLKEYFHINNAINTYEGTLKELTKDLKLAKSALVLRRHKSNNPQTTRNNNTSFVLNHLFRQLKSAKIIVGTSALIALLSTATPLGFQAFTDKVLPYSADGSLIVIVILLLLGAIATNVLQCFKDYQESILFAKYQNGLGKEVFARLLSMEVPFFDRHKIGDLTKLVDQIQESANFLVRQLLSSIVSLVSLFVVLPILFMYSPMLSMLVLGIGVLMALTVSFSLKSLRKRVLQSYSYDATYQSTMIEMVKGMRTIKSLANESHFKHRINTSLETNLYGDFHIAKLSHLVRAIVNFQSQLITISIIFFGAQAVFANELSIGQLIAFNMMAGNVVNPLISLVMTASGWETFKIAKKRLEELEPAQIKNPTFKKEALDLNGTIEFQDVWFRYPSNNVSESDIEANLVLKGINLSIQPGEIIGIVGGSGSGKSTLANLLLGFYKPTRGKIKINGYDIDLIPPEVLHSRISSVQQTNFLFNTSVLENVHLGRLNSSIEEIQTAIEASGSNDFVDEMPQKMLTNLSEDGANLSGGQRQRLAIARALVRNSDILLFDEATSALDNQTEEKVKDTIYRACQSKTGVIIAHRLNTLSYCDRIVVMQQGQIEVVGTHEELVTYENSYKAMWDAMLKRDASLDREELKTSISKDDSSNIAADHGASNGI
ncbi:peptidase domain-containing ABC transporter [Reinekea forsetii]|uniref:Toxin RTX-I translocation ATP-binding protein n=1 Tax=Reinekea forsetii TaxID=1336806 RepID=A0A2K8KLU1_9GAMM|nr:peptidase domain-containing ABC transporter [Reinekea forsetii]ATX75843.1 toxin RTX-I translocation ATP-binding protein [Reinekea forsetii]